MRTCKNFVPRYWRVGFIIRPGFRLIEVRRFRTLEMAERLAASMHLDSRFYDEDGDCTVFIQPC